MKSFFSCGKCGAVNTVQGAAIRNDTTKPFDCWISLDGPIENVKIVREPATDCTYCDENTVNFMQIMQESATDQENF